MQLLQPVNDLNRSLLDFFQLTTWTRTFAIVHKDEIRTKPSGAQIRCITTNLNTLNVYLEPFNTLGSGPVNYPPFSGGDMKPEISPYTKFLDILTRLPYAVGRISGRDKDTSEFYWPLFGLRSGVIRHCVTPFISSLTFITDKDFPFFLPVLPFRIMAMTTVHKKAEEPINKNC